MEVESAGSASSPHGKQAACLNCRRSKIRCNRLAGESSCEKCKQTNAECIVPNHHLGRQKGVKNKRKGLEKAIHQIEQAIKRPKVDSSDDEAQRAISVLQELLGQAQGQLIQNEHGHKRGVSEASDHPRMTSPRDIHAEESLTLDDAENPLQLLARASDLQLSPTGMRRAPKSPVPLSEGPSFMQSTSQGEPGAKSFFVPTRANLDIGPEVDPIELGLVTFDESESLFSLCSPISAVCCCFVQETVEALQMPREANLSLNKIVSPSSSFDPELMNRLARAECIDAKRALHMDGFDDVDPSSEWGLRLLRRRERAWIALYVVERGVCLARGRSYTVPPTTLIENCDRWHLSTIADPRDGPMNSMAVLRRDLDGLFQKVKSSCDSYRIVDTGSEAAQSIKKTIQTFYERWYATWALAIGEGDTRSLPPYVEILVTHTQLSTYGGVINHPTAPIEVKRFFRAAGLSSALNVLRAAIQGESRLKSMPNNTVIMISFAACSALSLSITPGDSNSSLAPSVRNLIEETAGVLERIGATPSHRNGASVLYGRFLRELIRRAPALPLQSRGNLGKVDPPEPVFTSTCLDNGPLPVTLPPEDLWFEPLHFSAMSDNQIVDAVNRAGTAFGASIPDVPLDDMLNWDWLDFANPDFNF
ncbi:hypothetical protein E8E15_009727 [Penicillium rubens]|nr:hypothetical protein E8E15_009727 [Penicillium rubens]